jgi:hypothetical protein
MECLKFGSIDWLSQNGCEVSDSITGVNTRVFTKWQLRPYLLLLSVSWFQNVVDPLPGLSILTYVAEISKNLGIQYQ